MEYYVKPRNSWKAAKAWRRELPLLIFGCLLLVGCQAEPPPGIGRDAQVQPASVLPPAPLGCDQVPPLPPPIVNAGYANPSPYTVIPLSGQALGATHIQAFGGAGSARPGGVTPDGSFCIEITLMPNITNSITLIALDHQGCPGQKLDLTVGHQTANTPGTGGSVEPRNVAKGAPITAGNSTADGNPVGFFNDGELSTWAQFSFYDLEINGDCDKFVWVRVDFDRPYTITKFRTQWWQGAGSNVASCMAVLLTNVPGAGVPDPLGQQWKAVAPPGTSPPADGWIPIQPEIATSAALLLYEDGATGISETFDLAEFEVWGQDPSAMPTGAAPRCP